MTRRLWLLLLLAAVAAVAGCTARDKPVDDQRQGGIYGGVSGGLTR